MFGRQVDATPPSERPCMLDAHWENHQHSDLDTILATTTSPHALHQQIYPNSQTAAKPSQWLEASVSAMLRSVVHSSSTMRRTPSSTPLGKTVAHGPEFESEAYCVVTGQQVHQCLCCVFEEAGQTTNVRFDPTPSVLKPRNSRDTPRLFHRPPPATYLGYGGVLLDLKAQFSAHTSRDQYTQRGR